jgi:predicted ATPase/DNA-binding SARP family transcriptional activator
VEFRILGPLEVLDEGRPLGLGGAKQRALLAVLLLEAGAVVSAERLVDWLWGEDPPGTARSVLQVYVANLRKVLEPTRPRRAASSLLRTQPPGYLLDLRAHAFDLVRFERLAAEGRDALAAGDPGAAATTLRQALSLWRGPVLGDVAAELGSQGPLARLEEQRLAALEQRVDADLALGRHAELVGELEALVTAHPLRERLRGQLMVALYRCGRQAEALDAYRQTRETLAEELGIDPSRVLQDLERAVLAQDPTLDLAPSSDMVPSPLEAPARPEPTITPPASTPLPTSAETVAGEVRRMVTVLCLGVTASTPADDLDPEFWRHLESSYASKLRVVAERHGGTILEPSSDAATMVYGVPSLHENDTLRAVRAAAEAREVLSSVAAELAAAWGAKMAFSAGVQTGEVILQADWDQQPHLAGGLTGLARQLEQAAAPGEILLDAVTCGLVRDAVRIEQARPLLRRGQREPVATWRLVQVQPRARGRAWRLDAPMIGRSQQLAQLVGAFEVAVADQAAQLFTILGPAGVGKSRLTHECLQRIGDRATVLRGRCLDYGEGITFWALGEIVKARAGVLESDGPAEATAKLTRAVEAVEGDLAERQWLMVRLAPLVGLGTAQQASVAERSEAFAAWGRFLEAVAACGPLVLVVEDLHWADEALLAFLTFLAESASEAPLLLICTARPELYERAPGWGGGLRNATTAALGPLSDADTARLLAALLDQPLVPANLQATLLARAGGNPLYAEEFVRLLADRGLLQRHGRGLRLVEDAELPVPGTVQALIAARLDALDPAHKAVLQDAAVVGQVFWSGAVAAIGHIQEPVVRQHLHELARKELVRPARRSSVSGQAEHRFWHVLTRDVAYAQLPRATRAAKHAAATAWIEQLAGERVADHAELLAHHSATALELARAAGNAELAAELTPLARRFLVLAGDRAMNLDVTRADHHYQRALELVSTDHPERSVVLAKAAEAVRQTGQLPQAQRLYEQAVEACQARGDLLAAAHASVQYSDVLWYRGETARSLATLTAAVEVLEREPPGPELAWAYAAMASHGVTSGRTTAALEWADKAIALAGQVGADEARQKALQHRSAARTDIGDLAGLDDLREALQLGLRLGLARPTASAYANLTEELLIAEGPEAARRIYQVGLEYCSQRGIQDAAAWLRMELVDLLFDLGDWEQALTVADELLAWHQAQGGGYEEIFVQSQKAHVQLLRDELAAAAALAEQFLPRARANGDPQILVAAFPVAALVAQGRGDLAAAIGLVEELDEATREGPVRYRAYPLPNVVRLCVAAHQLSLAQRLLDGVEVRAARLQHCVATARAVLTEARGDLGSALRLHADAAERWRSYGSVSEHGHALLGMGRCLVRLGHHQARDRLLEARAIFARLGARLLLTETDRWLEQGVAQTS